MDIIKAIECNDTALLVKAIQNGYNINVASHGNMTPLVLAVHLKLRIETITILINNGADLDQALVKACHVQYYDAFKLILKAGGDADTRNSSDVPLLHIACLSGLPYVKLLLLHGANPNITCKSGNTPLHHTIEQGACDIHVIQLLLDYYADLTLKNQNAVNPTQLASIKGYITVQVMLAKAEKNFLKITNSRRGSNQHKRKNSISDILFELNKVEKKQKTCQKAVDNLTKKLTIAKLQLSGVISTCRDLRKKLVKNLNEENMDSQYKMLQSNVQQLECPICFIDFDSDTKIYQCHEGHLYCHLCKNNPKLKKCPQCDCSLYNLKIRNRALETMVAETENKTKLEETRLTI